MADLKPSFQLPSVTAEQALTAVGSTLIDVRKPAARAASGVVISDAQWIDPFALDHDHPLTRADGHLIVFCVHGHEVSQFACALLRMHGRDAVFVTGGADALLGAGAPTKPLSD